MYKCSNCGGVQLARKYLKKGCYACWKQDVRALYEHEELEPSDLPRVIELLVEELREKGLIE